MRGLRHLLLPPNWFDPGICSAPPGALSTPQGWFRLARGGFWASRDFASSGRPRPFKGSAYFLSSTGSIMRAIDYFDKGAEATLDRTAIVDGDASWSYREMRSATQDIARAMWASGLGGEESAGIYSHNDARVLLCMLGIMRSGAVWVPINYRNAIDANVKFMNYAGMAWLFYHSEFRDTVREIKSSVPSLRHLICLDTDEGEHPSLGIFIEQGKGVEVPDWGDAYGNIDRL